MGNGFGKPKIKETFESFKYFKLRTPDAAKKETETELVVRLLPPMHSYEDTGKWRFFYANHYGYMGVNQQNPDKPRHRPFLCIQEKRKDRSIASPCPKCEQIEKVRNKLKRRDAVLLAELGIDDEKSKEFVTARRNDQESQQYVQWLRHHNCDKKWWINVMSKDVEFGVLQINYTLCKTKLIPLMEKLEKAGKDPFEYYYRFTRSGKFPVVDSVELLTEEKEFDGVTAAVPVKAPMTDEQVQSALRICPDLSKDVCYSIDFATIQELVNCDGSPTTVDSIWPPITKSEADNDDVDLGSDDSDVAVDKPEPVKASKVVAPKTEKPAPKAQKPTPTNPEDFLAEFDENQ